MPMRPERMVTVGSTQYIASSADVVFQRGCNVLGSKDDYNITDMSVIRAKNFMSFAVFPARERHPDG